MRVIALIVRAGAVVVVAGFLFSLVVDGGDEPVVTAQSEPAPVETTPPPKPTAAATEPKAPPGVVTIAATGDIDMGSAPNGGRSLFSDVQADLAGDVVLGNLEGTLSSDGTPPAYAARLLDAGFTVLNLANDHTYDFGSSGLQQTIVDARHRRAAAHRPPGRGDDPARRADPGRAGRILLLPVDGLRHRRRTGEAARPAGVAASGRRDRVDARRRRGGRPPARPSRERSATAARTAATSSGSPTVSSTRAPTSSSATGRASSAGWSGTGAA